MKTQDLVNCARPVLFENRYDGFEYSIGGTAFVVTFGGTLYAITAKHVLNLGCYSIDQFRIQIRPDTKEFLSISELYTIIITDKEDSDQFDLAILEVGKTEKIQGDFLEHAPYELRATDKYTELKPTSKFIFRGFPTNFRKIDWESKTITQSAFFGHGEYVGSAGWASTHKLRLLGTQALNDPDGLSGSPLFQIIEDENGYGLEGFAGMLIRSSAGSDIAYFLDHVRIIDALIEVYYRYKS